MIGPILVIQYAVADVPPPRVELSCPSGTTQQLQSRRWTCAPNAACQTTADCGGNQTCEEVGLCIEQNTVQARSGIKPDGSPNIVTNTITYASTGCDADGACDDGECTREKRCVAMPAAEPPATPEPATSTPASPDTPPQSGPCASAPAASGLGLMVGMLGLMRRRAPQHGGPH